MNAPGERKGKRMKNMKKALCLLLALSLSEDISQDAARLLREEGADFGKIKEYLDDNPGIRGPEYADPGRESGQLELMLSSLARRLSSSGTEKKTPAS